jgi:hypothetical protein
MPRARKGNAPRKGGQRRGGGELGARDSCLAASGGALIWLPVGVLDGLGWGTPQDQPSLASPNSAETSTCPSGHQPRVHPT